MRNTQIDFLKGFGILFVVLIHIDCIFQGWIHSFIMPQFFFAAGFLRYGAKTKPWGEFIKGKAKNILLPYLIFWALSVFVYPLIFDSPYGTFGVGQLLALLLSGRWLAEYTINSPLWYLPLFFIAIHVFEFLVRRLQGKKLAAAGVLLALAAVPFQELLPSDPVYYIDILPVALVFMLLGFGMNHLLQEKEQLRKLSRNLLLCIALLALGFLLSQPFNTKVSEIKRLLYFPGAFCTTMGFYILGCLFGHWKIFRYLGANSLYIFGIHSLLWTPSYALAHLIMDSVGISSATLTSILVACIAVIFSCCLKEIFFLVKGAVCKMLPQRK